jgi:hypothetical protein
MQAFIDFIISCRRYGHWSTKFHSWLKIYTHLITMMLCNFFLIPLFCGFLVRWLIDKHNFLLKLGLLLSSCVGKQTIWWTTQNELFCVTLFKNLQLLQLLFLTTRCRFSWRWLSIWTTYNPVVTLSTLRIVFRQLYFMCKKCIHVLCIFLKT